jgi:serine/threonine-protein kinase SRPK3
VAIKILSGYATGLNRERKLRELEVLLRLSSVTPNDHCAKLLTQFIHPGIDDDEEHLCLVMELFSSNIQDALDALQTQVIPVPAIKRILRDVLLGIERLHMSGIAHTGICLLHHKRLRCWLTQCKLFADVKIDNIVVELGRQWSTEAIDTWIKENPPRTHAPQRSLTKMVTAYVSQPLPPPPLDALASCNFKLAGFSRGTFDELCDRYPLLSVNLF